jgi:hypothetical protein
MLCCLPMPASRARASVSSFPASLFLALLVPFLLPCALPLRLCPVLIPIPHLSASRRSSRRGERAVLPSATRHATEGVVRLSSSGVGGSALRAPGSIHSFRRPTPTSATRVPPGRTGVAALAQGRDEAGQGQRQRGHGGDEPGVQYVSVLAWTATPRARRLTAGRWGRPAAPAETAARTEATSLFCSVVAHAAAS